MYKKNILLSVIIVIGIIVVAVYYFSTHMYSLHGNNIETVTIGKGVFHSEVVSSDAKMQKGLGGRNSLCNSCAMLFKFSRAGNHSFWMKDMRFPLDIIWILNGRIAHIEKNIPTNFSGTIAPMIDADQVLEINAGIADKIGIETGDKVVF